MQAYEKLQRSVDSLERIYAVVVAFAVTAAIEAVLFDKGVGKADYDKLLDNWPALLAFVATIVPFYHGMHRHLNRVYIENRAAATTEGFLLLDFFVFFVESCILLIFASSLDTGVGAFIPLIALFVLDLFWAFIAHGIHYKEWKHSPWKWGAINLGAAVLLWFVLYSTLFPSPESKAFAAAVVAVLRTVADYYFCWDFYFPKDVDSTEGEG